jgi:hypothetical protein
MARAKNRSTSQKIAALELEIAKEKLQLEVENLSSFLSDFDAEKLNFLLGVQSKLNKLRLDYDVKINQSPVEKEIDSIRTFAQKESDRQDAENEKELEA